MNSFFTGALVALGSIWFKAYIDNRYTTRASLKEKALEAYILVGKLPVAVKKMQLFSNRLLEDKNIEGYFSLTNEFPDNTLETLKKLEVLVVENFSSLKFQLLELSVLVSSQLGAALDIPLNFQSSNTTTTEYSKKIANSATELLARCILFQQSLTNEYIIKRNPPCNFFYYLKCSWNFFWNFFSLKKYKEYSEAGNQNQASSPNNEKKNNLT